MYLSISKNDGHLLFILLQVWKHWHSSHHYYLLFLEIIFDFKGLCPLRIQRLFDAFCATDLFPLTTSPLEKNKTFLFGLCQSKMLVLVFFTSRCGIKDWKCEIKPGLHVKNANWSGRPWESVTFSQATVKEEYVNVIIAKAMWKRDVCGENASTIGKDNIKYFNFGWKKSWR